MNTELKLYLLAYLGDKYPEFRDWINNDVRELMLTSYVDVGSLSVVLPAYLSDILKESSAEEDEIVDLFTLHGYDLSKELSYITVTSHNWSTTIER